jgi:UDP-2,3-diacylglucosamine pyrophosphatase LpxH
MKKFAAELSTLALSDLHFGRPSSLAREPEALEPLLQGFERVLLLGDIIDHWYVSSQQAHSLQQRIQAVCRKAGVKQLVPFRGNHDACGEGEEFALFDGVLYLHGHAVYHRLRGKGAAHARIQALNQKKFGPSRAASRAGRPFWKAVERLYTSIPMALWLPAAWPWPVTRRIRRLVGEVAPPDGIHAVVLGHSHRPGTRRLKDLRLFNLGGWLKNTRACAFVHIGPQMQLIQIENRHGFPAWGKVLYQQHHEG